MTARKWRQTDLAKHAEISTGTVSNVLRGIRVPSVVTLDLILSALEFSTDETVEMRRLRDLADPRGGG
jgi:transcriptional regulator with XRE-family HTH domain